MLIHQGFPEANKSQPSKTQDSSGTPARKADPTPPSGNHILRRLGGGRARQPNLGADLARSILGDSRVHATLERPPRPPPPRGRAQLSRCGCPRPAPPPLPRRVRLPGGSRAPSPGEAGLYSPLGLPPFWTGLPPALGAGLEAGPRQ